MVNTRIEELTSDEVIELLERIFPYEHPDGEGLEIAVWKINAWISRGDHVAVYENQDLGHPLLGDIKFASYGSHAAQLEVETAEELPARLPDGIPKGAINWRYLLKGVYEGEML